MVKVGIVIATNDADTVWNIFRFSNAALGEGHAVKTFLLGKGVEIAKIDDPKYKDLIKEERDKFDSFRGGIIACGTCLRMRQEKDWDYSPIATLKDMLDIVEWADKVLVFSG